MNEPNRGYIQIPSLHAFDYNTDLHLWHVRKSVSVATHASLDPLRSARLPILPVGCWPPNSRFNLDPVIPHAYGTDVDHSAQYTHFMVDVQELSRVRRSSPTRFNLMLRNKECSH